MTEQVLRDVGQAHELRYGILRYFNFAGADPEGRAGQSTPEATHLIKVAAEVVTGRRTKMEIYGEDYDTPDGTCIRDYIHVSDLADAHVHVMRHLLGGGGSVLFNCGYGHGYSVREVIAAVEEVAAASVNASGAARRAGDPPQLVADSSALRAALPWKPRHQDLNVIVKTALDWEHKLRARA